MKKLYTIILILSLFQVCFAQDAVQQLEPNNRISRSSILFDNNAEREDFIGHLKQLKNPSDTTQAFVNYSPIVQLIQTSIQELTTPDLDLRKNYCSAVSQELWPLVDQLKAEGKSTADIARALVEKRRAIGAEFKEQTWWLHRYVVYARNWLKYRDMMGPTYAYLTKKGKTPEQIIASAQRGGGEDLGVSCRELLQQDAEEQN